MRVGVNRDQSFVEELTDIAHQKESIILTPGVTPCLHKMLVRVLDAAKGWIHMEMLRRDNVARLHPRTSTLVKAPMSTLPCNSAASSRGHDTFMK